MQHQSASRNKGFVRWLLLGTLAVVGVAGALAGAAPAPANGDRTQEAVEQQHLSGAERSVAVLREIKDVLERIDGRLQRLEDRMSRWDKEAPGSPGNAGGTPENARGGNR